MVDDLREGSLVVGAPIRRLQRYKTPEEIRPSLLYQIRRR